MNPSNDKNDCSKLVSRKLTPLEQITTDANIETINGMEMLSWKVFDKDERFNVRFLILSSLKIDIKLG